jgi:uncharacterized membrane protein
LLQDLLPWIGWILLGNFIMVEARQDKSNRYRS